MRCFVKYCLAFIIMVLVVAVTGCGLVEVVPEKDRQRVVAEVYGESILKGEFLDAYNQQKVFYGITEEIEKDPQYRDAIKEIKKDVLEQLITRKVLEKRAEQAGFVVNDGYLEEARKEVDEQIQSYADFLKEQDQAEQQKEGKETKEEKDYLEEARSVWQQKLDQEGVTEEEYIQMLAKDIVLEKFSEKMLEDVEVTDQDIQGYYHEQLNKQKADPTLVQTSPVQLYRPAGWLRIKHILISISIDERIEYFRLIQQGKQEEADKYLEEKLKAIEPRAQEVFSKAKAGEDFEILIEKYSEDKSSANKDEGYVIYKGSGVFTEEVEQAAFKLKEGEISQPIGSPFGYHIVKLYEKLPEEVFSLEEKKDEIKDIVLDDKRSEKWNSLVQEWKKQANIKKYEGRL